MPCRDDVTLNKEDGRSTVQNDRHNQTYDSYIIIQQYKVGSKQKESLECSSSCSRS